MPQVIWIVLGLITALIGMLAASYFHFKAGASISQEGRKQVGGIMLFSIFLPKHYYTNDGWQYRIKSFVWLYSAVFLVLLFAFLGSDNLAGGATIDSILTSRYLVSVGWVISCLGVLVGIMYERKARALIPRTEESESSADRPFRFYPGREHFTPEGWKYRVKALAWSIPSVTLVIILWMLNIKLSS